MKTRWMTALLMATGVASRAPRRSPEPETTRLAAAHSQRETDLAGDWRLEFRAVGGSPEPQGPARPWITFTATLVQVDSAVGGAMRSDGPSGQFGCRRRTGDVCAAGRMRLSWDEQDWQVFEFRLTPGSINAGSGRAEIRFPTGATDRYTFTMTRLVPR